MPLSYVPNTAVITLFMEAVYTVLLLLLLLLLLLYHHRRPKL